MMVCVRQDEINRVRRRNCRIRNANHILKTTLKNLCDRPYSECDKILQSVVDMCKKTPCESNCNHPYCYTCPVVCSPSCPQSFPPKQCPQTFYCIKCRPVKTSCCAGTTTKCYCACCLGICPESCCPRKPSPRCKPCTRICCTRSLSPCRKQCAKPNPCCSPPKRRSKSFCSPKKSGCCIPTKVCDDTAKCNKKDTFANVLGRLGAGCSSGGCGGYTPSGWNKIMTKTRALCDSDPCTCCPPSNPCRPSCTPSNPCRPSCTPSNPCRPSCNPCSPCKLYNPCSPCKPYNPCSPCKPYNPCSPCSPCKAYNPCNPCSPCKPYSSCSPCKPYNPCKPSNPCSDSICPSYKLKFLCRPNLCCTDICNSQAPSDDSSKSRPSLKLLGELAFQLERRILDYVFGMEDSKRRRFYGYTVSNIFSMMERETKFPKGGSDIITKSELAGRLKKLLQALEKYGYNIKTHGEFAQEMVNKYGLLACPPDESTIAQFGLNDPNAIAHLIQQLAQGPSEISSLTILLNSLKYLSKCDQRPLFIW